MLIALAAVVSIGIILYLLIVRPGDILEPLPESPFLHLDERKAAIYENLRDLQFEYRVGKLSDIDYQQTKKDLQVELAAVHAEVDQLREKLAISATPVVGTGGKRSGVQTITSEPLVQTEEAEAQYTCPSCKAVFRQPLKFCGECGKPMVVAK